VHEGKEGEEVREAQGVMLILYRAEGEGEEDGRGGGGEVGGRPLMARAALGAAVSARGRGRGGGR
jgi:hypothetical protein